MCKQLAQNTVTTLGQCLEDFYEFRLGKVSCEDLLLITSNKASYR